MRVLSYRDRGYRKFVDSLDRRAEPSRELEETVAGIVDEVRKKGDRALIEFTRKFDGAKLSPGSLFVSEEEFAECGAANDRFVEAAESMSASDFQFGTSSPPTSP